MFKWRKRKKHTGCKKCADCGQEVGGNIHWWVGKQEYCLACWKRNLHPKLAMAE